jgi:dienelactone hydrolase
MSKKFIHLFLACLNLLAAFAFGQELNHAVNEEVVMLPKPFRFGSINLETTIYKPKGDGPFPLVVINHGKASGDPRFQSRYRHSGAARFFLQRGYAVLLPMRQGFSKSEGAYISGGCNVESNGRLQAEDVQAVLDHVVKQTWADKNQILVMGQSHGGWTSLAFGTVKYPGVRGLVNFAGGLRQTQCSAWEGGLIRAAKSYGEKSSLPSLWFYGDNDSYFSPYVFHQMHEQYVGAGGKAELVAFGSFGSDAHSTFGSRHGESIWQPAVEKFMHQVGLPTDIIFPEYAPPMRLATPATSGFAGLLEIEKVPHVSDKGREGYQVFLSKQQPRAFAVSEAGAWGWAEAGDDPLQRALDNCNKRSKEQCRLYAVDDQVVWLDQ